MWQNVENMIDRLTRRSHTSTSGVTDRDHDAVAIRCAHDADTPTLHDLAAVDSARPLEGPVLVAVVDGRIWAALALEGDRVIADPFLPTSAAVELLALRVRQLRAADGRRRHGSMPRRVAGRLRT